MNNYYWQQYASLLDYKDLLYDYVENLDENSEEYKKLDDWILDILDIQCYINNAFEKLENYKQKLEKFEVERYF